MVNLLASGETTAEALGPYIVPVTCVVVGLGFVALSLVYLKGRRAAALSASSTAAPKPDRARTATDEPLDTEPAPIGAPASPPPLPPLSAPVVKPQCVTLSEIVHEMIEDRGTRTAHLNKRSFEVVLLTEDQVTALENDYAEEHGNVELDATLRESFDAGDLLELPSKYDTQEFSLRERFCDQLTNEDHAEQLRTALRAAQAFREFDQAAGRLGIKDQWEHYRERSFEEIAVNWLDDHDIPYDRGRAAA